MRESSRRRVQDRLAERSFLVIAWAPIALVLLMIVTLALRSRPIVAAKPIGDLLFGQTWLPLQGQFGFAPFIVGTLWVTLTTMIIAIPICVLCALYLSEYAGPRVRGLMKPLLDILAAIPSVIYGVWGLLAIVPFVQSFIAPVLEQVLGFIPLFQSKNPTGFSIFSAGLVLAVMVTPVIVAVTYEDFVSEALERRGIRARLERAALTASSGTAAWPRSWSARRRRAGRRGRSRSRRGRCS